MAKYFLHVKVFSRGKGSRVTRAAAYRAGERIRDERTSEVYNYRRGKPQAHSVFGQIEPAVVEARADDVIHAAPRRDAGNHLAHEEPRERGVAVGGICNPSPWNPGYSQPHASSADTASLLLANRSSVRPSNIASERSSRP